MDIWDDPDNAGLYDQFARKHRMYRDTSCDLVELAGMEKAGLVVDLGCGTGVTTEAILGRLDRSSRVIGIDASASMLHVARMRVPDARVRWVEADGAEIASHATGADAIICNSAIWQMEMDATIHACGKVLRSGGRLVFNIFRHSDVMRFVPERSRPRKPTFIHLIQATAVIEQGFVPPNPALPRGTRRAPGALMAASIKRMISRAGLVLDSVEEKEYDHPAEAQLEWLRIPAFAENILPGLPYQQQLQAINAAYVRFKKEAADKRRWALFVAHKP